MDGVTEELRKLQIREAELLKEQTEISVRRASIIDKDTRENQSRNETEKNNSVTQPPRASQAAMGGATKKIIVSKSLQIGDSGILRTLGIHPSERSRGRDNKNLSGICKHKANRRGRHRETE